MRAGFTRSPQMGPVAKSSSPMLISLWRKLGFEKARLKSCRKANEGNGASAPEVRFFELLDFCHRLLTSEINRVPHPRHVLVLVPWVGTTEACRPKSCEARSLRPCHHKFCHPERSEGPASQVVLPGNHAFPKPWGNCSWRGLSQRNHGSLWPYLSPQWIIKASSVRMQAGV